jgi:rsbT co-antagonist protein RsbR
MHFTQRQITMGVFGLVTLSALCLSGLYALRQDETGLTAAGIGSVTAAGLWVAYYRGWEQARQSVAIIAAIIIPFALTGNALTGYVHPIIFFPAVLAVVLTTPRWILGVALGTYLLLLQRAGWAGRYTNPEMLLSYLIIVSGLFVSRLATDSAQRMADLNAQADAERLRAEAALAEVSTQAAALSQALAAIAEREEALASTIGELQVSEATVQALSAPMLPVLPGVLVAPLVGNLDSSRAKLFAQNLLAAIEQQRARWAIFDITGVPVIDTQVAQTLLQAAAAASLLGTQVLLVGIRPEVAQTLVSLNVTFGTMTTYANLQEALRALLSTGSKDGGRSYVTQ